MTKKLISESGIAQICRYIHREYRESRLDAAMVRLYAALGRLFSAFAHLFINSLIIGACFREKKPEQIWHASFTYRALSFLLNLPGLLLRKLYLAFREKFDESVLMSLVFEAGDGAALMESWVILALWIIPFKQWDNTYHLLGFLAVLALLYVRTMRGGQILKLRHTGVFLAMLAAAVVLSVALSHYPNLSQRYLRYHIICMICVFVTVNAPRSTADLKRLAAAGGAVILISAAWAAVQRFQGVDIVAAYVDKELNAGMPGRVQSYFDNPNTYAQVLVMLLPLTAPLMITAKKLAGKAAAVIVFLAGVFALGMTYSRASWIGLAAAALIFLILWKPRLIPPLLILAVFCVPLLPESILNRLSTIGRAASDSTVTSRFPLYGAGAEVLVRSPIFGAGLGGDAVKRFIRDRRIYPLIVYYAHLHNVFLEVWVENGLLGIFSFLGASCCTVRSLIRRSRKESDKTLRLFCAASCASLVGSLLTGMVDYIWAYPRVMCIFWFVFAFGLAALRLSGEEKGEEHV